MKPVIGSKLPSPIGTVQLAPGVDFRQAKNNSDLRRDHYYRIFYEAYVRCPPNTKSLP